MNTSLHKRFTSKGPKKILALDGGGVRGILTLGMLEKLEANLRVQTGLPELLLCDYFDLIGGTSTGSIIASGLAIGMSVKEIKSKYFELGDIIFAKKKNLLNYITKGEKYDVKPLTKALKEVFGTLTLGDQEKIKTGLCIVTKRADTFSTWPFTNHPDGKFYHLNKDIELWKIIRASSAAPTYFLPLILDVGGQEKGAFIDGGVSMANNPSLTLLLMAILKGFPYHWNSGEDNLLMVSFGTGNLVRKHHHSELKKLNLLSWAGMIPEHLMTDANYYNQIIMQIISDSPTAKEIDQEIGDLSLDKIADGALLSYLRYDVLFDQDFLKPYGLKFSKRELEKMSEMDNPKNMKILYEIGSKVGEKQIKMEHIPESFLNPKEKDNGVKRFKMDEKFDLPFNKVVKKPIPVEAVQIHEPFEVESMEGVMKGKAGDYLMKGLRGEYYVCDQSIFKETYETLDDDRT